MRITFRLAVLLALAAAGWCAAAPAPLPKIKRGAEADPLAALRQEMGRYGVTFRADRLSAPKEDGTGLWCVWLEVPSGGERPEVFRYPFTGKRQTEAVREAWRLLREEGGPDRLRVR